MVPFTDENLKNNYGTPTRVEKTIAVYRASMYASTAVVVSPIKNSVLFYWSAPEISQRGQELHHLRPVPHTVNNRSFAKPVHSLSQYKPETSAESACIVPANVVQTGGAAVIFLVLCCLSTRCDFLVLHCQQEQVRDLGHPRDSVAEG